jgi:hypothetical protein
MTGWIALALKGLGWLAGKFFGSKSATVEERLADQSEAKGRAEVIADINSEVLNRVKESQEARNRVDADYYERVRTGQAETPNDGFRRD